MNKILVWRLKTGSRIMSWIASPQTLYIGTLITIPQNATIFVNKAFKEVIKLKLKPLG